MYLGPALRGLFPMLIAVALLVALRDAWPAAELGDILARLGRIGPGQWALSLAATAACFGCFARSEAAVHRGLGPGETAETGSGGRKRQGPLPRPDPAQPRQDVAQLGRRPRIA